MKRRDFLGLLGAAALPATAPARGAASGGLLQRRIPSTGEMLPAVGMGTWLTFHIGTDARSRAARRDVLRVFFERGGRLIDSSPMYGRSEELVGELLPEVAGSKALFSATKVWTPGRALGIRQMERSFGLWGLPRFDLMQVHNLVDWQTHLPVLREWKAAGRLRYVGVTTSHGRRHDELETMLKTERLDFVQFTYNLADREVEERLLPLAADRGVAVIINRPLDGGALFDRVRGKPLPAWAAECGASNWAQFFLKFVVSHPAVSCAIPATRQPDHMRENMGTLAGPLPDAALRRRMAEHVAAL
jgi:diketogulonate reductase-like aldo/keto reductase